LRLPCERRCELKTASIADVLAPFEMSEELSAKIRALTQREGTTLFITFLTALKALINLSTGQNDIMLGVYMAKRNAPESDRMMGYFCDVGPLRTRVSSDSSFLELLSQVRMTVLNAHAHEEIPFDLVSEELRQSGQAPPDIRAIFMVESFLGHPYRLGDLEVNPVGLETARNTMPWRFQMRVRDGGRAFHGRAKFDARLHDPQGVRMMMRNYVRLLDAVVAKPTMRLCDVEDELGGC
jgi:non-ribosomal peptide synthetase component F